MDADLGLMSSSSSSYLPYLATSPSPRTPGGGIFRRRSSSRLLFDAQQQHQQQQQHHQQQQQPPLAATGAVAPPPTPAKEGDYLLGGRRAGRSQQAFGGAGTSSPEHGQRQRRGNGATAGVAAAPAEIETAAAAADAANGEGYPPLSLSEMLCDAVLGCGEATWQLLGRMCANPSIRAAMVAFALGIVPPVKALFVGGDGEGADDPPLGAFTGAMEILGTAQVPCSMLMLSGSGTIRYLNDRAAKSEVQQPFAFSPRTVLCIIVGRVLLFPIFGLLWWWAGFELGLFMDVPVLSLVLLLDAAVPTAQNIVMLILVHGKPEHGHVSRSSIEGSGGVVLTAD